MKETVEGPDTIFPFNFLTFLYGQRSIPDCAFIDSIRAWAFFCSHVRRETEPVFSKINSLNDLLPKQLIASLHVGSVPSPEWPERTEVRVRLASPAYRPYEEVTTQADWCIPRVENALATKYCGVLQNGYTAWFLGSRV